MNTSLCHDQGIALIDKPVGKTSFYLVKVLRKITSISKIGHAGTLDPFASGLMILLVGKNYTRKADTFIGYDKDYIATLKLGEETDSYDCDGQIVAQSDFTPSEKELHNAFEHQQGTVFQTPPMFSAKKVKGKKLYELARKGQVVERAPKKVFMKCEIISYDYPYVNFKVTCSSGTYIRSIAHDVGQSLGCGAHLTALQRTRIGPFHLQESQQCDELVDKHALNLRQSW